MLVQKGFLIWLTGISSSGKTTIASLLEGELLERGLKVELLDEGNPEIAENFCHNLSFSLEDKNIISKRFAIISKLLVRNDIISIVVATSPTRTIRDAIRVSFDNFLEVYVKCPIDVCKSRDVNSLYEKASNGELDGFLKLILDYEEPLKAEVITETDKESPEDSVRMIIKTLELLEWIPKVLGEDYSLEDETKIHERLESLGYL